MSFVGVTILLNCLLLAIFSTKKNKLLSVCLLGTTGFLFGFFRTPSENHTTVQRFAFDAFLHICQIKIIAFSAV